MKTATCRVIRSMYYTFCLASIVLACGGASSAKRAHVISPQSAAVLSSGTVQFMASVGGKPAADLTWYVNGIAGGAPTTGTISPSGLYIAPTVASPASFQISASRGHGRHGRKFFEDSVVTVLVEGEVTPTQHPLVTKYAFLAPPGAAIRIQFGTDTNYGRETWKQRAPEGGGEVDILVAGMRADTLYHMRAQVRLVDGATFSDVDHTFTTGDLPSQASVVTTTTTPGSTPQPGLELVNADFTSVPAFVTDLSGNMLWWYAYVGGTTNDNIQSIKLLPNGHFILLISPTSSSALGAASTAGAIDSIREIDLAGNTIRELSIDDFSGRLKAAGYDFNVGVFHHDILPLPNGHFIVLTNTTRQFMNLPGFPGPTNVLGDLLVDLDENLNPVWVWNEFDHLDVNRHPYLFSDWTHTNAIIYSADDGQLIISIRHQNWLVKIDYRNGEGMGDVLWRLGYQGDFTLLEGMDPTDWFFAQHGPSFCSPNTSGEFSLCLFDNGNDRVYPSGETCQSSGAPTCPNYSTAMLLRIDEAAKTALLTFHDKPVPAFSVFGGNAELLSNGDIEFDESASTLGPPSSDIYEVTQTSPPQTVWHLHYNQFAYRGFRLPSLYPGVQW